MNKNNIYLKFNPFAEVIGVPFLISRIIKGKKIRELLDEKIEFAREKALKNSITEIERFERNIEYGNLDNFFANHFRLLDNSLAHTFEDKIEYCLAQYYKESRNLYTSTNLVVLEENFLKGAEKTLFLFYILLAGSDKVIKPNIDNNINNELIGNTIIVNENISKIENSIFLKEIFISQEIFNTINSSKLKEYNLVYDVNLSGFQVRHNRYIGDLILLIFLLDKFKVVELPSNTYIIGIFKEIFNITISANNFGIYKDVLLKYENSKRISKENKKSIEKCTDFINRHILKIENTKNTVKNTVDTVNFIDRQ